MTTKHIPGWTDAFTPNTTKGISRRNAALILVLARRDRRVRRDPDLRNAYFVYGHFGDRSHLDCRLF